MKVNLVTVTILFFAASAHAQYRCVENGCKIKGLATPGVMASISNVDVTFSGCTYTSFNRRMLGTLALYPAQKYAQFGLNAISVGFGKVAESFDIRATLRR